MQGPQGLVEDWIKCLETDVYREAAVKYPDQWKKASNKMKKF